MQTKLATRITLTAAFALASLGLSACDPDGGDSEELRAAEELPKTEYAPAQLSEKATTPAPAPEIAAPPQPPADPPAPAPAKWQAWVDAEVSRIESQSPEWFAHVMSVEPQATRSGFLRLVGPELEDPNAAPVLLHRYLEGGDDPEAKAAVVAALGRSGGDYAPALVDLLASEPDATVRVGMVSALRRAEGPAAVEALAIALADPDAEVRLSAAINAGRHEQGAQLAEPLTTALADPEPRVQAKAARTIGILKIEAFEPLKSLLTSEDAEVRLRALQAIDRIDPDYAAGLSLLDELSADSDATVARAAQRIAAR